MARSENSRTVQKVPEVTFSIEVRPATSVQLEAGRRLFERLVDRSQSNLEKDESCKVISRDEGTRSAPGGTA